MKVAKKTAIVTGANNGIGFETALGLAKAGCHVVLACRNTAKAEAAEARIAKAVPGASLELIPLDLSDFESVRSFVASFRSRHDCLDLLINNAGILLYSAQTNDAGVELQFATNHLGHFVLTALLLDVMPDSPASRVVSLSSVAHKGARIHFDDLSCAGNGQVAYGQSKLACLIFAEELDRRLRAAGRQVKSIPVHPGGSDSGLFEEMSRAQYLVLKVLSPFITHSNAAAAKPALNAALSADIEGGTYWGPTGIMELRGRLGRAKRDRSSTDPEIAARLWSLSESLSDQRFFTATGD